MKKLKNSAFLLVLLLNLRSVSQVADSIWVVQNYTKSEVMIPMRDGKKLFTAIYTPVNKDQKHPILVMRTPYSVGPYGKDAQGREKFNARIYNSHWSQYAHRNYIIVMQDVRGRYMSEGDFVDVRPYIENKKKKTDIDEASDSYDTFEWLIKNVKNNNGNIGVFGISYPGFYSTMAALSNHPAVKAVSPQAPVTDWFMGDDFHHNGAFALMDAFSFYYGFGVPRPKPTASYGRGFQFPEKDNYRFYLKQGALKNFKKLMGDSIAFWNELMEHPDYDAWWKARDARSACKNIQPAILTVGGLFDAEDCYGAWNLYKAIEKQSPQTNNKIVMGPWVHGGWHRGTGAFLGNVRFGSNTSKHYQDFIELPFFEAYLNNVQRSERPSEAQIFLTGTNEWRNFDSWPPKESTHQEYFLNENSVLSKTAPTSETSYDKYVSDPLKPVPYTEDVHLRRTREYMTDDQRFASRRTDVLVYETELLTEDITLAGEIIADLKVSISTTDADFVVKVIDVFPDDFAYDVNYCCKGVNNETEMAGYQMLVRGEIMRGRYRNSFEKPEAFTPGKNETVRFSLPDVAHTFKKGHRIMVQIQSSWFPLFDRNPQQFVNIYKCDDRDFISSEIKVLHQKNAQSRILLPVLAR